MGKYIRYPTQLARGEKVCTGCKEMLPLEAFGMAGGKPWAAAECRECHNTRVRLLQRRKAGTDKAKAIHRRFRANHPGKSKRDDLRRDPVKQLARRLLKEAVRCGRIVKPERCSDCGTRCRTHGHHSDYSQPYAVEWLCPLCHGKRHRVYTEA